jgi:acyl-coenzyme A thioesterase PaaI-like protein
MRALQDYYPDAWAHCLGCGRLNESGYHLRSFWEGEGTIARFVPRPYHIAIPGFVNGGLLASLVDCHATATASAAAARAAGLDLERQPAPRFVTGSLRVDYLHPTPLGPELVLRARATTVSGRKVIVGVTLTAGGELTVRGEVVCVELPESMRRPERRSAGVKDNAGPTP